MLAETLAAIESAENIYGVGFVGGNPKGWNEAFSDHTKSGKVLRKMVKEIGLRAQYIDLWDDPMMEEKYPHVTVAKFLEIYGMAENGYQVVILGFKVKKAIMESLTWFPVPYYPMVFLPHPASRRPVDLQILREGLTKLKMVQRR